MPDKRIDPQQHRRAARAIIFQILDDEHAEYWIRAELKRKLGDFKPDAIDAALARMHEYGVVCLEGEELWASRCARHLDAIDVIGI
ncbi:MAG TPA: hypothetical protein VNY52_05425 [Solirubrobacteraceae bacterium]|jgi:hypothetical protein|nr:hypothetical protein [Solirubrobacteraceae bacterium]